MLVKIDYPALLYDRLQLRGLGEQGFSEFVMGRAAAELTRLPDATTQLQEAVGRLAAGEQIDPDEYVIAGWRLNGSRIMRPLGLLHLRAERWVAGTNVTHLGSTVLAETCDEVGIPADHVDHVQGRVVRELNKDSLFGQGLMAETRQVLASIGR